MPTAILEREDIQALVRSGFGKLEGSRLLLVRVRPGREAQAREWLREAEVLSVADFDERASRQAPDQPDPPDRGHRARASPRSGVPDEVMALFPADFLAGIAGDERRSHRLGDVGENSPSRWKWGRKGNEPHLLLMLYADCADIEAFAAATVAGLGQSCEVLQPQLDCSEPGIEPFGFKDGISQPRIDWDGIRTPGGTRRPGLHQFRQRRRGAARLHGRI